MNFRPELAEAVVEGRKTVTRRLISDKPRSPYHPHRAPQMIGKTIAICPGRGKRRIGEARVLDVERERFVPAHIAYVEARLEGFNSIAEFLAAWRAIHGSLAPVDVWRIAVVEPRRCQ